MLRVSRNNTSAHTGFTLRPQYQGPTGEMVRPVPPEDAVRRGDFLFIASGLDVPEGFKSTRTVRLGDIVPGSYGVCAGVTDIDLAHLEVVDPSLPGHLREKASDFVAKFGERTPNDPSRRITKMSLSESPFVISGVDFINVQGTTSLLEKIPLDSHPDLYSRIGQKAIGENIAYMICSLIALSWFHEKEMAHGDFKPGNIFMKLVNDHRVIPCVGDNDLIRRLDMRYSEIMVSGGSPHYCPIFYRIPREKVNYTMKEQDIFAAAVSAIEVLSGDPHLLDYIDTEKALVNDFPQIHPSIPAEVRTVLEKALRLNPMSLNELIIVLARTYRTDLEELLFDDPRTKNPGFRENPERAIIINSLRNLGVVVNRPATDPGARMAQAPHADPYVKNHTRENELLGEVL